MQATASTSIWRRVACYCTLFLSILVAPLCARERTSARLLTIGNSFADDATAHLPGLCQAGGKELVLFRANLGGASLARHASHLVSPSEPNPQIDPRPSKNLTNPITGETRDFSLPEALRICPWDYVTIQQVSIQSFRPESFHPYTDTLIQAVNNAAPQAELLIHQTWAYREDHPIFRKNDGFTPLKMYEGLRAAYRQLALETNCRLIPVGDAFHVARQTARWKFEEDKFFDYSNAQPGQVPDERTSLNLGWYWKMGDVADQPTFVHDPIHANSAGKYLGASVFYLVLFDAEHVPTTYRPSALSDEDAAGLRAIAEAVVRAERDRVRSLASTSPRNDRAR